VRTWTVRLASTLARSERINTEELEKDALLVAKVLKDSSPAVRRQIAIALHGMPDTEKIWTALAMQHDGKDRWYLEALGIGAAGKDDACLDTWLAAVGTQWNTPAGRDIIWRLRAAKSAEYLARIIVDKSVAPEEKPRFVRAFDFLPASSQKSQALITIASTAPATDLIQEAMVRLKGNTSPEVMTALKGALVKSKGTPQFVELVRDFGAKGQGSALLDTAVAIVNDPAANDAVKLLLADGEADKIIDAALATDKAVKVIDVLGNTGTPRGFARLTALIGDAQGKLDQRQQAVRALARTQSGAETVLKLAKNQQLPAELSATAGSALRLVQFAPLKAEIETLFPAPAALGGKALPPIPELAKLKGDVSKGQAVFERAESSCVTCHRVGDKGVDFAPALSEIGTKLPKEQIYDSIINPNAGLSMGFETTQLTLKDGAAGVGIIRSETGDELILALPGGATQKYRKGDVAKREKLTTSLMPSGLNQALSQDDLVNLVEYLATLKKK
jgi:putative heme-binding domain-containing protein